MTILWQNLRVHHIINLEMKKHLHRQGRIKKSYINQGLSGYYNYK